MEERRYDGSQHLTDNPDVEEIKRALADAENRSVRLHRAGEIIEGPKGKVYQVQQDGSWRRIDHLLKELEDATS